jgi:DNA gyrase subunit B
VTAEPAAPTGPPVPGAAHAADSYTARHLSVLEGLEAVRKRPGMYIGSTDSRGLMHCLWEIFDNSVDEALAGHCTAIEVVLHADGSAEVRDNGRGIPVDVEPKTGLTGVELVMTRLHAGGKFGGGSYTASGGLHGVGASVVNALAARLDVSVERGGHEWAASFRRGVPGEFGGTGPKASFTPQPGLRKVRRVAKKLTGTRIRFWPDPQVFVRDSQWSFDALRQRARQTAYLVPGLTIRIRDEREPGDDIPAGLAGAGLTLAEVAGAGSAVIEADGGAAAMPQDAASGEREDVFRFDGGISEFCAHLSPGEPVTDVLRLAGSGRVTETIPVLDEQGHMTPADVERELTVDVALRWGAGYETAMRSFVNVIATPKGGTHVTGFERALVRTLNEQLRAARLLKNGDEAAIKDDVAEGLTAVIAVRVPEPQFEGQTKEVLGTPAASRIVAQVVAAELRAFFEARGRASKQQSRALLEKVASAARARIAAREHRDNQRRKSALATSALPAKLVDCRSADDRSELFIVEGDSALGTAKLARDSEFQALLPIRGKILNVQRASLADMLKNTECAAIIQVIGAGSGASFELDSARYQRVILMSVAPGEPVLFTDADGRFTLRRVGAAVDERIESAGLTGVSGTVSVDLRDRSTRVSPVKQFIRHRHSGTMYRITTAYGRCVTVTGGHSVFSYEGGELTLKPASELRVGDLVIAPCQLPRPAPLHEIDLAALLRRAGQEHALRVEGEAVRRLLARKAAERQPVHLRRSAKRYRSVAPAAWLADLTEDDLSWLAAQHDGREVVIYARAHRTDAVPRFLPITEELCYVLGWYLAEGSLSCQGARLNFALGAGDDRYRPGLATAIRQVTGRAPVTAQSGASSYARHLYVHAPVLARAIKALGMGGTACHKRLPDLLLNCGEQNQLAFLEGYFLGDGTKDRRGRVLTFATSSPDLADGLLYLLGQLGVLAGTTKRSAADFRIRGGRVVTKPSYMITVSSKAGLARLQRLWRQAPSAGVYARRIANGITRPGCEHVSPDLVALPIREIETLDYDGHVYDLSVPEDENFISGTGGLLTHNTDADVDGAHIRCLLLTLFNRYLRPMLDAGRVFAAVPPLHRIELANPRKGQRKYTYTYSDAELRRTLLELERKGQRWKEPVQRYKGLGEMDAGQLAETTMDPRHRTLRRIRIEDAAAATAMFDLLMGSEVAPRRDFIVGGAAELDPSRIDA